MKIYVYPADEFGCGYYRMIWPSEVLRASGHDVTIVRPKDRKDSFKGALDTQGKLIDVYVPPDADVIVLQRITHRYLIEAIKILRKKGISVVMDIDDDLAAINPANPAFAAMHPTFGINSDHSWQNTQLACEASTYVITSTENLLSRYAPHGRGQVIHNYIPERYLTTRHEDSDVIGWGGSVHSHPDDLQVVGAGISQVTSAAKPFHVIGSGEGVRDALRLDHDPVSSGAREILHEWPAGLTTLGIGVAPLADTRFNASKSWLKPLEYTALGVPWVASPRVEYQRLHKLGVGLLAGKPRQWASQLRKLSQDKALRVDMSQRGREIAREFTIEKNAWRWIEAWDIAHKIDHLITNCPKKFGSPDHPGDPKVE